MNTWRIALVLMVTFAMGSGCAKPDWIQQTLVTVDVTGTWVTSEGPRFELKLDQRGSKVTGSMLLVAAATLTGNVEGSVAGDVFRFTETSGIGSFQGEMTVSGDEMAGTVDGFPWWKSPRVLRRVDSSRPSSQ